MTLVPVEFFLRVFKLILKQPSLGRHCNAFVEKIWFLLNTVAFSRMWIHLHFKLHLPSLNSSQLHSLYSLNCESLLYISVLQSSLSQHPNPHALPTPSRCHPFLFATWVNVLLFFHSHWWIFCNNQSVWEIVSWPSHCGGVWGSWTKRNIIFSAKNWCRKIKTHIQVGLNDVANLDCRLWYHNMFLE